MKRQWKMRMCRAMMMLATGGAMFQLSCSDNVRDAVLQGLEATSISLSNILIQALFDGLTESDLSG